MSTPPSNPPSNRSTPAPRGRPAPRAGYTRKSKAERDRYAAEQAERDKARSATPASTTTAQGRGGRGAGRGARGALAREASRPSVDGTGFGVFGGNTGAAKFRSKENQQGREEWLAGGPRTKEDVEAAGMAQAAGQGGSTGGASGGGGGGGGGVAGKAAQVAGPQDYLVPEDDELQVERRDIERIWISSDDEAMDVDDDEDDIVASKGKRRATSDSKPNHRNSAVGSGLRPVRAPRAPLETDEIDEDGLHGKRGIRKPKRKGTAAANVQVILDDSDPMDVDQPTASAQVQSLKSPTSSPELKKKTLAGSRRPTTSRTKSSAGHQETQEERAERLRVVEDTSKLLDVFAPQEDSSTRKGKRKSSDQGRLFLLQFPPITPLLIDPTAAAAPNREDEEEAVTADRVKVKSEHDPAGGASQKNPAMQKQAQQQQASTAGLLTADSTTRLPHGFVGKLNVHASGKISLDWAGTAMEVKLGTEVDFLQDAVLLQPDPLEEGIEDVEATEGEGEGNEKEKEKRPDGAVGKAYALGQVQGKLVVTPAWGRIFD